MTRWLVLSTLAFAALIGGCEPTTYGQTVQQQKRAMAKEPTPGATPDCPTVAAEGSPDYEWCERMLREQAGTGGAGAERGP